MVERVQEIGDHRAVVIVGERHRVGAAAELALAQMLLGAAVLPEQLERAAGQDRGALGADDLDALGEARIGRGRRIERAERAVGEADAGADQILGLHAVHGRRAGERRHLDDGPGQALEQVERVDRLGEQHAAAVARLGATTGLVVVGLRPPPAHRYRGRRDRAERAVADQRFEAQRVGPKPMLQHQAERDPAAFRGLDQARGALDRDLDRLLEQHVLAGRRRALDQLEVRGRRAEDEQRLDGLVGEQRIERIGGRQLEFLGDRVAARARAGEHTSDLDPVGEVEQALGVRRDRHAGADHGDATPGSALGHL